MQQTLDSCIGMIRSPQNFLGMHMRAALYLRVSTTDGQTTENQRLALAKVAGHRGWEIVHTYEDAGISGAKGRDQRPAFNQMLKDAVRRRFDVCMCWSIDRLGRSVLHVASAMAELDAAGVALYSDQQAIDSTSPFGKAMIQMACVFGELEREMIRAQGRRRAQPCPRTGDQEARSAAGWSEGRDSDPPATWLPATAF